MKLLDAIRDAVRHVMRHVARSLNGLTGGRLSPNMVTIIGLLAHIPIAWMIAQGYLAVAGLWLIIFGLFDTLDGELARLQNRASAAGMFLDSITDRMKEIIVYMGLAAYILNIYHLYGSGVTVCSKIVFCHESLAGTVAYTDRTIILLIGVLGGSLLTSYLNAWGEAVMSRSGASKTTMNKTFRGGLASFEIRIALLVVGLLSGYVLPVLVLLGVLVSITLIQRTVKVFQALRHV